MDYTEGENGYLLYVPNLCKVVAVRVLIIKESTMRSIPNNTETPDLLDEGHSNWGPGNQMMIIKMMATKRNRAHLQQKKELHEPERVNTQETTLR